MAKFTIELECEVTDNGFIMIQGQKAYDRKFDKVTTVVTGSNDKEFVLVGSKGKVFVFEADPSLVKL